MNTTILTTAYQAVAVWATTSALRMKDKPSNTGCAREVLLKQLIRLLAMLGMLAGSFVMYYLLQRPYAHTFTALAVCQAVCFLLHDALFIPLREEAAAARANLAVLWAQEA